MTSLILILIAACGVGRTWSTPCPSSPADLTVDQPVVLDGERAYEVELKHQVFRPQEEEEGLLPGVTYTVVISISGGKTGRYFNGLLVTVTDANGSFAGEFLRESSMAAGLNHSFIDGTHSGSGVLSPRLCNQPKAIVWLLPSDDYVISAITLRWRMTHGRHFNVTAFIYEDGNWYRKSILYSHSEGCVQSVSAAHGFISEWDLIIGTESCSETLIVFEANEFHRRIIQFQLVNFMRFDCSADFLEVMWSSGPSNDWNTIKVCSLPDKRELSRLHFITDDEPIVIRGKLEAGSSFRAIHYTLDRRKGCNATLSSTSGVLSSPNYPRNYFPGLNCYIHLKVGREQIAVIRLKFLQLHQRSDGSCSADYVQLMTSGGRLGRKYCGAGLQRYHRQYLTFFTSNDVVVHFHSDWLGGGKGFMMDYAVSVACGKEIHTAASEDRLFVLQDDETARMSDDSAWDDCFTAIHVPYGYVIKLTVTSTSDNNDKRHSPQFIQVQGEFGEMVNNEGSKCSKGMLEVTEQDTSWVLCDMTHWNNISYVSKSNHILIRLIRDRSVSLDRIITIGYTKLAANHSNNGCIYGWSFGWGSCYLLVRKRMSWTDAEKYCEQYGGHLVSIPNYTVQNFLNNLVAHSLLDDESVGIWTGGHDRNCENCYEWSNGQQMVFSNWFKGWSLYGYYGWQPSDDGMSNQDCVEMRKTFMYPTKGQGKTDGFYWNDRDCTALNPFVCETPLTIEPELQVAVNGCNRTVKLSFINPVEKISSPLYPRPYPNDADCVTRVTAPRGTRIVTTFETFHLEDSPSCEYDYLELLSEGKVYRRVCGDWKGRIKLLRHISPSNQLQIHFVSDHSHTFQGYQAQVSIEGGESCDHERMVRHDKRCYLIVPHPLVTWDDAQQKCAEIKSNLADLRSEDDKRFLLNHLVPLTPSNYPSKVSFWLEAPLAKFGTSTYRSITTETDRLKLQSVKTSRCLYFAWTRDTFQHQNGNCDDFRGYICQKEIRDVETALNKTVQGESGVVTSPGYPSHYPNSMDYTVKLMGQPWTRLVLTLTSLNIEWQKDCLYDYLGLRNNETEQMIRLCGNEGEQDDRWRFVATRNIIILSFHSDYSVVGPGFSATWKAVDVSGCPVRRLQTTAATLVSPNYPEPYLDSMNCETIVETGLQDYWIWLQFQYFWVGSGIGGSLEGETCLDDQLVIDLWNDDDQSHLSLCGQLDSHLPNLAFISFNSTFRLSFSSGHQSRAKGYEVTFTTVESADLLRVVRLNANSTGRLLHLNYPNRPPPSLNYIRKLILPLTNIFYLHLEGYSPANKNDSQCDQWSMEVVDPYGESRKLCKTSNESVAMEFLFKTKFNILLIHELTGSTDDNFDGYYKVSYTSVKDPTFITKSSDIHLPLESCDPNPCVNGGSCKQAPDHNHCACHGHFTGLFCHLTVCELNPCGHGTCNLTSNGYQCHCHNGYTGPLCDTRLNPCSPNPCGSRGACVPDNQGSFHCRCQIWWQGPLCESKAHNIPYKPLSQRMLEEPFWLGLITVFSVLAFLGFVWCIKRKFADKIERFLSEELDKSQKGGKKHSLRDGGSPASLSPHSGPRGLLGRIGLRKHSMLSLDSSESISPNCHENRSFSLADIGRKSDSQKRLDKLKIQHSESSPAPLDKKELLQSLVTPTSARSRRMSLDEFFQMSERKILERNNSRGDNLSDCDSVSNEETSLDTGFKSILGRTHFVRTLEKIDSVSFENERDEEEGIVVDCGSPKGLTNIVQHIVNMEEQKIVPLKMDYSDGSSLEVDSWGSYENTNAKSEVLVEVHEVPRQLTNRLCDYDCVQFPNMKLLPAELKPLSRITPLKVLTVNRGEICSSNPKIKVASWDRPGSPTSTPMGPICLAPPRIEVTYNHVPSPRRKFLHAVEKSSSLDLPIPMITITANTSSCESDMDSPVKTQIQMNYLSPFEILRQDSSERSTSLSNLSSSGYSSMTSPGPSRCNSNSPLFYTDNDSSPAHRGQVFHPRSPRHSPLGLTIPKTGFLNPVRPPLQRASAIVRKRSDSETTDDQPEASLPDSDEGIGMDHIDVKIHRGELTCAKDLALYMDYGIGKSDLAEGGGRNRMDTLEVVNQDDGLNTGLMNGAPSIVVQSIHQTELDMVKCWKFVRRKSFQRKLSPVSSRSESPLSDRGPPTNEKYSSLFYPNENGSFSTDSDELYDSRQPPSPSEPKPANPAAHRLLGDPASAKVHQQPTVQRKRKTRGNCSKTKSKNKGAYKRVSCNGSPMKLGKNTRVSVESDSSADETSASSEDFPTGQINGFFVNRSPGDVNSDDDVFDESCSLPLVVTQTQEPETTTADKKDDYSTQRHNNTNTEMKCSMKSREEEETEDEVLMVEVGKDR